MAPPRVPVGIGRPATTFSWRTLLCGISVLLAAGVASAEPAGARLDRVLLLRSDRGVSLVLELTAEPDKAIMESVAGAVFAIEVGPVIEPVSSRALEVPTGVSLIDRILVEDFTVAETRFVRARVELTSSARTNLRVVGRRVYVDVAAAAARREVARRPDDDSARGPLQAQAPLRHVKESPEYQAAIAPIVERFEDIAPFLVSAATSGSPDVLEALRSPLLAVHDSLNAVEAPARSRAAHALLISAATIARRAVAADFSGERVAQANRALAALEAAKIELGAGAAPTSAR